MWVCDKWVTKFHSASFAANLSFLSTPLLLPSNEGCRLHISTRTALDHEKYKRKPYDNSKGDVRGGTLPGAYSMARAFKRGPCPVIDTVVALTKDTVAQQPAARHTHPWNPMGVCWCWRGSWPASRDLGKDPSTEPSPTNHCIDLSRHSGQIFGSHEVIRNSSGASDSSSSHSYLQLCIATSPPFANYYYHGPWDHCRNTSLALPSAVLATGTRGAFLPLVVLTPAVYLLPHPRERHFPYYSLIPSWQRHAFLNTGRALEHHAPYFRYCSYSMGSSLHPSTPCSIEQPSPSNRHTTYLPLSPPSFDSIDCCSGPQPLDNGLLNMLNEIPKFPRTLLGLRLLFLVRRPLGKGRVYWEICGSTS